MSDFRHQIQQHYDAQALSAGKVEAWLAEGRAVAAEGEKVVAMPVRTAPAWRFAWAIAAALVVFAGLSTLRPWEHLPVSYVLFAPRIVDFFATPPELPKRSQNPEELRSWLIAQGAPADFQIPEKLRGLKSFGCQVVDVHGHPAYLTCFWSEKPGADMGSLVHLLVAKRSDFRDAPPEGQPQFRELAGWNFAAWSQGDVIYTMATAAPMERLQKFADRGAWAPRFASAKMLVSASLFPAERGLPRASYALLTGTRGGRRVESCGCRREPKTTVLTIRATSAMQNGSFVPPI